MTATIVSFPEGRRVRGAQPEPRQYPKEAVTHLYAIGSRVDGCIKYGGSYPCGGTDALLRDLAHVIELVCGIPPADG
jgi:hypothetical protein